MEQINLTKDDIKTVLSALLFASSVNVIYDSDPELQTKMFNLAKFFKQYYPDVQLENVEFIKEENYEEEISNELLETFKENIKIVTFDQV